MKNSMVDYSLVSLIKDKLKRLMNSQPYFRNKVLNILIFFRKNFILSAKK
jgi:hypothetical protein